MIDEVSIRARYKAQSHAMNEKSRGLFVAAEARAAGRGGPSAVARSTRVARSTVYRGIEDIDDTPDIVSDVRGKEAAPSCCPSRTRRSSTMR
jgi:hypothetical protein